MPFYLLISILTSNLRALTVHTRSGVGEKSGKRCANTMHLSLHFCFHWAHNNWPEFHFTCCLLHNVRGCSCISLPEDPISDVSSLQRNRLTSAFVDVASRPDFQRGKN